MAHGFPHCTRAHEGNIPPCQAEACPPRRASPKQIERRWVACRPQRAQPLPRSTMRGAGRLETPTMPISGSTLPARPAVASFMVHTGQQGGAGAPTCASSLDKPRLAVHQCSADGWARRRRRRTRERRRPSILANATVAIMNKASRATRSRTSGRVTARTTIMRRAAALREGVAVDAKDDGPRKYHAPLG